MPLGNTPQAVLRRLGVELKNKAGQGEQFCVFAFDCMDFDALSPNPEDIHRADIPFTDFSEENNWNAAFYGAVRPAHTEASILKHMGSWLSAYSDKYGNPRALYIYSRLIPCLRDGCANGHCADMLADFMRWTKRNDADMKFYIGWGNDDRDPDMARAIRDLLADLEDDGLVINLYPRISIA